jgi:hypothetical protein
LMVICSIQIGPESGLLGDFIGLDPDRRGHGDGTVEPPCDLSKAERRAR